MKAVTDGSAVLGVVVACALGGGASGATGALGCTPEQVGPAGGVGDATVSVTAPSAGAPAATAVAGAHASATPNSNVPAEAPIASLRRTPVVPMRPAPPLMLAPKTRTGLRFGWPPGFRVDDPSVILMYRRPDDEALKVVAMRLERRADDGDDADVDDETSLTRRLPATGVTGDVAWRSWQATTATSAAFPARVRTGRGHARSGAKRDVLAVILQVGPDLPRVGVVAAWPTGDEEASELARDVVRHAYRCRWRVGHGCVRETAPSGEDAELTTARTNG